MTNLNDYLPPPATVPSDISCDAYARTVLAPALHRMLADLLDPESNYDAAAWDKHATPETRPMTRPITPNSPSR